MYFPIIDVLKENFIAKIPSIVTQWLTDNVDPVGSAVVVDTSLSISGAAADAKITGDEISDLKSDISDINDALFNIGDMVNPDVLSTGWGLDANGLAVNTPSGQSIIKYIVTEGEEVYFKAQAYWQFQNDPAIPTWNNQSIVGGTHYQNDGFVTVPQGATYLIISRYSGDGVSGVYETKSKITENKEYIDYLTMMTGFGMFQSIAGIGDSFTEGDMVTSGGTWVLKTGINYLSAIGKRNGVTIKNYGSGGATTETYQGRQAFTEAITDTPCDLYILALGQNDINTGMTKGTIADINTDYTQNPNTFYGNYGKIISQLMDHAPNARFVILGSWVSGVSSASGIDYQSYNDAIEEIAEHFGFPYINPFDDSFFSSKFYKNNMSSGHPVAMGYMGMSYAMERLFSKCVFENSAYFKYALIG